RHWWAWTQRPAFAADRSGPSDPPFQARPGQVGQKTARSEKFSEPGCGGRGAETDGGYLVSHDGPLDASGRNRRSLKPQSRQDHQSGRSTRLEEAGQNPKRPAQPDGSHSQNRTGLPTGSQQKV